MRKRKGIATTSVRLIGGDGPFWATLLVFLAFFPARASAQAASLSVGAVSGKAGQSVDLPINYSAGSSAVSTVQFDLRFTAPLADVSTSTGAAAAAAGKSAQGNAIAGGVRVLVFGLNQTAIGSGPAAIVRLAIAAGAPPGRVPVIIGGIIASDPNGSAVSVLPADGSVVVTPDTPDTMSPVISEVTISNVTGSGALVTWRTDEPSDSQVEYGLSTAYGNSTALNTSLVSDHIQVLTGLSANTLYNLTVKSRDGAGNLAVSGNFTFMTTSGSIGDFLITLSYPRLSGGDGAGLGLEDDQYTGVAVANLDGKTATIKFTAFDSSGEPAAGTNITNPVTRTLGPGGQLPIVDSELFGSGLPASNSGGWVKLESPVTNLAGFFLMFNSSLSVLDGGPVVSAPVNSFILSEIENQGFTRVHIANPNSESVTVNFELVQAGGAIRSSVTRNIRANAVLAEEVFSGMFAGFTPSSSEYIRVSSSRGVLPYELLGKTGKHVEALAGQDLSQGSRTLYCPQYVVGGSWRSTLSIINLDAFSGTVTLRFIRDDAAQIGESRVVPIPALGKIYIDDPGFFVGGGESLIQGYVEINGSVRIAGSVVFGDDRREVFSSALPLVGKLERSLVFSQVASNETYFTGIAILNPNDVTATATIDVYSSDGRLGFRTIEVISPRQRRSHLLTEYFPSLVGQNRSSGYVRVTVDHEVASFSLFGTNILSVLSAIPAQVVP